MCRNGCAGWGTSSSVTAVATTTAGQLWAAVLFRVFLVSSPLAIVVVMSLVVGLGMVLLFGYTSDQKAIKVAKDQLKAHLLAVRLFRDQLPVVAGSYAKILRGTGRYLRLAFMPLLYVIIPITLLIVQLDRCLGSTAISTNAPFLLTVRTDGAEAMNALALDLPAEIAMTAPAVHVPAENEVVWRLAASRDGDYEIKVLAAGETVTKTLRVSPELARVSPVRLRGHFWERMLASGESALPAGGAVESIAVNYPDRNIEIAGYEMNWIVLFFVLSMIAGYLFKELLGIQI
jgi:uncharacterized membrane protein (DUF106 family)